MIVLPVQAPPPDLPSDVSTTSESSAEVLHLMRTVVAPMLEEVYPQFAKCFRNRTADSVRRPIRYAGRLKPPSKDQTLVGAA
jgi:hypothetical protein